MHCARRHGESFSTASLGLSVLSPLPPKKNPCLHLGKWALGQEAPIFQVAGPGNKTTFLYISTCLWSISFGSSRQPGLYSATLPGWNPSQNLSSLALFQDVGPLNFNLFQLPKENSKLPPILLYKEYKFHTGWNLSLFCNIS